MKYLTLNLISTLRFLTNPRPVYRLKRNTLFRLTLIVLIGSAGLSACANFDRSDDYLTALRAAAEQGDVNAMIILGARYMDGKDVPQDYKEAVKWYELAAEQGHAGAQYTLGKMYHDGEIVPQDYKLAAKWYELAAKQGHVYAQSSLVFVQLDLGMMYQYGEGVSQDYELAVKWYKLAANQGYANAQYALGLMYLYGHGVQQDDELADQWFARAAKQGQSSARLMLIIREALQDHQSTKTGSSKQSRGRDL